MNANLSNSTPPPEFERRRWLALGVGALLFLCCLWIGVRVFLSAKKIVAKQPDTQTSERSDAREGRAGKKDEEKEDKGNKEDKKDEEKGGSSPTLDAKRKSQHNEGSEEKQRQADDQKGGAREEKQQNGQKQNSGSKKREEPTPEEIELERQRQEGLERAKRSALLSRSISEAREEARQKEESESPMPTP